MSPASKSKSKDKKEKTSKPSGSVNANSGVPASAYNPLLGTFQMLELVSTTSSSSLLSKGQFRNIDETDLTGVNYDSVSNNGSSSGDSEDHKEKTSNPPSRNEAIPGADNDKREKIRLKNERKHQRQKERRAQELHERCSQYLMSRKLEVLAQQLVAMGISQERAMMALILNEGKVEESIHWLFDDDGGKEAEKSVDSTPGNLKIDISEELAWIADMEVRYKCTKQEVESAVVAAEGDLEKAEERIRTHKQDQTVVAPKPAETGDPPTIISNSKVTVRASQNSALKPQPNQGSYPSVQQKQDEMNFHYTKSSGIVGGLSESLNQSSQLFKRIQPNLEWTKLQQQNAVLANKRWSSMGSNPSISYSQPSPLPVKTEAHYVAHGNEFKKLQQQQVRQPVIMMQRSQSLNTKQVPTTSFSSSCGAATNWYPTASVEMMKNSFMPNIPSSRTVTPNDVNSNQMYQQLHYHQGRVNGHFSRNSASQTLAAASSLGLFSGFGSTSISGSSSPVDWSTGGSMGQLDYTSIDWSLDRSLSSPRPDGLFLGSVSLKNKNFINDSNINGYGTKSGMGMAANSNGISIMRMQNGGASAADSSVAASHDWTSPFEERDLFTLPRQFASFPSL